MLVGDDRGRIREADAIGGRGEGGPRGNYNPATHTLHIHQISVFTIISYIS